SELVSRINVRVSTGHFDVSYDPRQVNFRITFPVFLHSLSTGDIALLLHICLFHVDIFEKAFMQVVEGKVEPVEAITSCIKPIPRDLKEEGSKQPLDPKSFLWN
ncbi:MAG: hypothetical protein KC964_31490, partial [Candidatus Omnitrophica bacterium]|nr:hypothetical protein [Candidatus Omnitrophota bacterium]